MNGCGRHSKLIGKGPTRIPFSMSSSKNTPVIEQVGSSVSIARKKVHHGEPGHLSKY